MTAVDNTTTAAIPKGSESWAVFVVQSSAAASFTALLEASATDGANWETVTATKTDQTTTMTSMAGVGISGKFNASGYTHVRLRLTAITTPSTGVVGRINTTSLNV